MEPVSAKTHGTLEAIVALGDETTLPAIAEQSGQSRSTVGRHLDELEVAKAVQTTKEEGPVVRILHPVAAPRL